MKKIISALFSILIAVALFMPKSVVAEDYKAKDFDFNITLADQLGIDISGLLVDEESKHDLLAEDKLGISYEVIKHELPESINVDLFKPLVLYFDLKAGVRIDNVIWYLEGTDYAEPHQVAGKYTNSNLLIVPSCAYKYNDFAIEAEVDYTDFRDGKEEKGKTFLSTEIHINDEIVNSRMQVVNVGSFSIFPNQSMNLKSLGIGKGTISLNKDGDVITLKNVEYAYDPSELIVDRLFTMNRGFAYYTFNNDFDDIEINLVGNNKISNLYRAVDIDSDGSAFNVICSGDDIAQFNPNYHLNGPGSLELYGGQYILQAYGSVVVNTKLDITSSKYSIEADKTTPARMGTGIYCVSATLTDKADVNMDIAGTGIDASFAVDPSLGNVSLEPGSKLNIINTSYIRHPWLEMFLPSKISGITYTNTLNIDDAEVYMDLVADADLYHKYEDIYELSDIPVYLITGIYADSKEEFDNNAYINDSIVKINIDVDCEEDDEYELIKATGIDVYNNYSRKVEPNPSVFSINNSDVDINIGKNKHIEISYGMNVSDLKIVDSDVDIDCYGDYGSLAILSSESKMIDGRSNVMDIIDSDVKINSNSKDEEGKAYGVYGVNINLTYDDESKEFVVNSKDGALLSYLDKESEELEVIKDYIPEKIFLCGGSKIKNDLPINRIYLNKKINTNFSSSNSNSINSELTTNDSFYQEISSIERQDNLELNSKEQLGASNNYYYYETIVSLNEPAKNIVVSKRKINPKPQPYVAPNTCVK